MKLIMVLLLASCVETNQDSKRSADIGDLLSLVEENTVEEFSLSDLPRMNLKDIATFGLSDEMVLTTVDTSGNIREFGSSEGLSALTVSYLETKNKSIFFKIDPSFELLYQDITVNYSGYAYFYINMRGKQLFFQHSDELHFVGESESGHIIFKNGLMLDPNTMIFHKVSMIHEDLSIPSMDSIVKDWICLYGKKDLQYAYSLLHLTTKREIPVVKCDKIAMLNGEQLLVENQMINYVTKEKIIIPNHANFSYENILELPNGVLVFSDKCSGKDEKRVCFISQSGQVLMADRSFKLSDKISGFFLDQVNNKVYFDNGKSSFQVDTSTLEILENVHTTEESKEDELMAINIMGRFYFEVRYDEDLGKMYLKMVNLVSGEDRVIDTNLVKF